MRSLKCTAAILMCMYLSRLVEAESPRDICLRLNREEFIEEIKKCLICIDDKQKEHECLDAVVRAKIKCDAKCKTNAYYREEEKEEKANLDRAERYSQLLFEQCMANALDKRVSEQNSAFLACINSKKDRDNKNIQKFPKAKGCKDSLKSILPSCPTKKGSTEAPVSGKTTSIISNHQPTQTVAVTMKKLTTQPPTTGKRLAETTTVHNNQQPTQTVAVTTKEQITQQPTTKGSPTSTINQHNSTLN